MTSATPSSAGRWITILLTIGFGFAFLLASVDLDSDGLPDPWQLRFGAQGIAPGDDEDGDSSTNIAEAAAGTDPFDADSYLRFASYQRVGDQFEVSWPSVIDKDYEVQVSNDGSTWIGEGINRAGTGGIMSATIYSDQPALTAGSLDREWYDLDGLPSWGLNRLRAAPAYLAETPNTIYPMANFQFGQSSPDLDNFGTRIRAYLLPPVTGDYRFHIASDDLSELFLSSDIQASNKLMICNVPGWTGSSEWDKYPSQHSEWITLQAGEAYYIEYEHFDGGYGDHGAVAWEGPGINFEIIPVQHLAPHRATDPLLIHPNTNLFRVIVRDGDDDGDGVSNYAENILGFDPANSSTTGGGLNDFDAISASLADTNRISVAALDPAAYEQGPEAGRFQFTRAGNLNEISATFSVSGSASPADYLSLSTSVHFPLGVRSVVVDLTPVDDGILENDEEVTVQIQPGAGYDVDGSGNASLPIEDARPNLFIARPTPTSGTATIAASRVHFLERGNRTSARISVDYANLSSASTETVILLDEAGSSNVIELATLPAGLVDDFFWDYATAGGASLADIQLAIDEGRLRFELRSADFPAGELAGVLATQANDAGNFAAPAPPPALPTNPITPAEAVRFLSQATFGPTSAEVASVQTLGYEGWIDAQLNGTTNPPSLHAPALEVRAAAELDVYQNHRQEEWFRNSVNGSDQLRQRVAFALSQILVVSDEDGNLGGQPIALGHYYDRFVQKAFGNYRELLEDVSKDPLMGFYLSHFRNPKADPFLGTNPDENYAREVTQLFSIGLVGLHPDGSPIIDPNGVEAATYNQETITNLARVFTGWAYHTADPSTTSFWYGPRDLANPMTNFPEYHDSDAKTIIDGIILPAGQTAEQDLDQTLDALFDHPNCPPFISRLLIQRLVTSNPSPGYIYRVASVFEDNGSGVRGDLGAVVKAILLDYEARSSDVNALPGFGKQHEPIVRLTRLLRLFGATAPSGTYQLWNEENNFSQAALRSPTVFNFFLPDYSLPGEISSAGLVSPEFQIVSETTIISTSNRLTDFTDGNGLISWDSNANINFDWQPLLDLYLLQGATAFVDYLDLYLCDGQMPASMHAEVVDLLNTLTHWDPAQLDNYKVQSAVQVVATSAQAAIQR